MQNCSTVCVVELALLREDAKTKRNRHRPWYGDGAYGLGFGFLKQKTILGAKANQHHGCSEKGK